MIIAYDPSHKDAFLAMTKECHAESRYHNFGYSEKKLLQFVANPNVFCALAFARGAPAGFFMGMVQPIWFAETKTGFDLCLYIMPKYRGGLHAARLIREFEKFCRQHGCVEVNLTSSAEISTELAERLYKKLGYRNCGFISRKDIA